MASMCLLQCLSVYIFFILLVPNGLAKPLNHVKRLNERIDSLEQFMRLGMDLERRTRERQTAEIMEKLTSIESGVNSTVDNLAITDQGDRNEQLSESLQNIINEKLETKLLPFYQGMSDIKRRVRKDVAAMSDNVKTCNLNNNEVKTTLMEVVGSLDSTNKWMTSDPESCKMSQIKKQFGMMQDKEALSLSEIRDDVRDIIDNKLEEFESAFAAMVEDKITKPVPKHSSCRDLMSKGYNVSGIYEIYHSLLPSGLRVYCDQETDGGGWTVIQRRIDGSVDFWRNWYDYKYGFGSLDGELWLGNYYISLLTQGVGVFELRVDMEDFDNVKKYAVYSDFKVFPESELFKLHIGSYSGDAGDSLSYHNNFKFTTKDKDNDDTSRSCAEIHKGGWWYRSCHRVNVNGMYQRGRARSRHDGVSWGGFRGNFYSLKHVEMKFRER